MIFKVSCTIQVLNRGYHPMSSYLNTVCMRVSVYILTNMSPFISVPITVTLVYTLLSQSPI
jgi:hypothetical protein